MSNIEYPEFGPGTPGNLEKERFQRSEQQKKSLLRMGQRVTRAGQYPSDADIKKVVDRTNSYTRDVVSIMRIGSNNIPTGMISTREEMIEDLTLFFEQIKKYSNTPSSIGITDGDLEFVELYTSFQYWLQSHEARIMQDHNLVKVIQDFDQNIIQSIDMKLAFKLGIKLQELGAHKVWDLFYTEVKKRA